MKTASGEVIPASVGTPFAGGVYLGRFFIGAEAFAFIGAPKAEGELEATAWGKVRSNVSAAVSVYDGLANTRAMAEAGSDLANWAMDLRIGGFDDWYLPSRGELLIAFDASLEGTEEAPALGAEAFEKDAYWSSSQYAGNAEYAWGQGFSHGYQGYWHKSDKYRARAVRRLKIT